ncbi:MAG: tetratricopeptide repeat protein [Candidatus Brocadiia bacterium]
MDTRWTALLVLPCVLLLSGCNAGLEEELAALREEAAELRGEYESAAAENEQLKQQLADLKEQARSLEADKAALAQRAGRVEELENEVEQQAEKIRTLEQRLEQPGAGEAAAGLPVEAVRQRLARLGEDLFQRNEFGAAHPVLLSALELGAEGPSLLYALAFCEASFGELEAAERRYAACATALEEREAPDQSLVLKCLNNHALVLSRLGRAREAADVLRRALELDESFTPAQFNLGLLYAQKLDRPAAAIEPLRRHVAHGGARSVSARRLIGDLQQKLEETEPAPADD